MKILQFGKFYPPEIGGIETVMFDITEQLNSNGFSCDVLCSSPIYKDETHKIKNYTVFRTKSFGKLFSTSITPKMIFKLREIICDYDIVHIHLPDPMANLALFCANKSGVKVIIHWHSDIINQKLLLKLYTPLQNWLLNRADAVIATTPNYITSSEFLNTYKHKCVAIPIGIDGDKLTYTNTEVESIRGLYRNKHIIFALGRLAYYKGFSYLVESAKYLSDDFVLLIGGSGDLHDDLQRLIHQNKLGEKVKLIGRIEDSVLGNYYQACDVFCLPSIVKTEAFGVVQIEAMSFGRPVVATKIEGSGVSWVNQHEVTGLNVIPKCPHSLAKAFQSILFSNDKYRSYSKNALERFQMHFKREQMASEILKVYSTVMKI
jgi:rhamnosyl/mannosyltransferase